MWLTLLHMNSSTRLYISYWMEAVICPGDGRHLEPPLLIALQLILWQCLANDANSPPKKLVPAGMLSPRLEAKKTGLSLGLYLDDNSLGLGLETLRPRPRVVRPRGLVYCNVLISCSVANNCSAPVERVFSQSGLIMRPNRARMSDKMLEELVFLTLKV